MESKRAKHVNKQACRVSGGSFVLRAVASRVRRASVSRKTRRPPGKAGRVPYSVFIPKSPWPRLTFGLPKVSRWNHLGLASGLSGGTRLSFCDMFWLHSFQKETQGTSGKNIGTAGERRIGGNFPDPFQHAFVLLGHLMPCEGKGGAKIDVADRYSVGASRSSFRGSLTLRIPWSVKFFKGNTACQPLRFSASDSGVALILPLLRRGSPGPYPSRGRRAPR